MATYRVSTVWYETLYFLQVRIYPGSPLSLGYVFSALKKMKMNATIWKTFTWICVHIHYCKKLKCETVTNVKTATNVKISPLNVRQVTSNVSICRWMWKVVTNVKRYTATNVKLLLLHIYLCIANIWCYCVTPVISHLSHICTHDITVLHLAEILFTFVAFFFFYICDCFHI